MNPTSIVPWSGTAQSLGAAMPLQAPQLAAAMNSSTVSPAFAIRVRKVPRATCGWSGMERVTKAPGFVNMMWLLR